MHTNLKVHTYKIIRKHLLSLKALLCSHSMELFLLRVQKDEPST